MITTVNQRWAHGLSRFVEPFEVIRTSDFDVVQIGTDTEARNFVTRHHYSGSYPAARRRFGLYHRETGLCGVAVFSQPMSNASLAVFPGPPNESMELGRFVLLDSVPHNGETWFLARCFETLRKAGYQGIVSYSDPVPRRRADGTLIFKGHIGTIYQAAGATYLGRGSKNTLRVLPDGAVFSNRTRSKLLRRDRGWRYAAEILCTHGADDPPSNSEDLRSWAQVWIGKLTTPVPHPGNHKYAWALQKRLRPHLPASLPYPKFAPLVEGGR